MSTESEFFRLKSFVACIIRCEARTFAELINMLSHFHTSIVRSLAGNGRGIEFCRWFIGGLA